MASDKDTANKLLDLYNEIDHFLRKEYATDKFADHGYLIQQLASSNPVVARHQQVMRAVSHIRNSLVHNPVPSIAQPITHPNAALVELYASIHTALLNPHRALHIAIPSQAIFTSTLDASIMSVMKTMHTNTYTHVPVIENDKMIGIFSENCMLSYIVSQDDVIITSDMTLRSLQKFLPLEAHQGECFEFLAKDALLTEVYTTFNKAIKHRKRIGMIFITEHGKETEKPLGIITAWDLASPEAVY